MALVLFSQKKEVLGRAVGHPFGTKYKLKKCDSDLIVFNCKNRLMLCKHFPAQISGERENRNDSKSTVSSINS